MVIGLLATTVLSLFLSNINTSLVYSLQYIVITIVSFIVFIKFKPNPLLVIIFSGFVGLLINLFL